MASVIPWASRFWSGTIPKRDRNIETESERLQDKAVESGKKAQYYADKAARGGSNTALARMTDGSLEN